MEGAKALETRLQLADLMEALQERRIRTRYQPIVRMHDRHPTGVEVLARLEHPVHGLVEADRFVPPMEAAGLGRLLSEAVVATAFEEWQRFDLARLGLTLAINMPLDVLLMPETLDWLKAERIRCGLDAEQIVIELTESQQLDSLPELANMIARYRANGYRLAIDDVGPSIRDHRPLLDMSFSLLKLDRSLVQGEDPDGGHAEFLAFSLEAAREVGLVVIAEGVEDEATWARMSAAGIDQAQGYFIGQPMQAGELAAWHATWCDDA